MANDLALSKTIPLPISDNEAQTALLKAASRLGKASINKRGEVVVRPRSAIHRLKMTTEIAENRSGGQVVTYSGKIGISFGMLVMWLVFCVFMLMTIIGVIIAIFAARSSQKTCAKAFENASSNAIEALM